MERFTFRLETNMKKIISTLVVFCYSSLVYGQFQNLTGPISTGNVQWDEKSPLSVPFITWGGDAATFQANGLSLATSTNSTYNKLGLNISLVRSDDFVQQVRDYMSGKSPFLRGTFHMIAMASEILNSDPRTQPVCIVQLTWSLGDHIVAKKNIKTLADLKGTTGAIQIAGPHVGLVDDALKVPGLTWNDIKIIWANDLTGSNGPAALFKKDPSISWCTVISPDMIGLTGGLQSTGGAAETFEGAHVVVSTAQLSRSIADVYCVRKDFYNSHRDWSNKFIAGYLVGVNQVIEMKKQWEKDGSKDYEKVLLFMQQTFGKDVLPSLEEDAAGMLNDLNFVGLPGNIAFFTETGNPNGLKAFINSSMNMALSRQYITKRSTVLSPELDFNRIAQLGNLGSTVVVRQDRFKAEAVSQEIEKFNKNQIDDRTIYSFTVQFQENQTTFPVEQYESELHQVADLAAKFGNAVIVVRGHSDPSQTLMEMVKAGMQKGILQRNGSQGNYQYSINGKPFTIENMNEVIQAIDAGMFSDVQGHNPKETCAAAMTLSLHRADNFVNSLKKWCDDNHYPFDKSQVRPQGVGIREPFIAKPKNYDEALRNMRVEFRLIRVDAEVKNDSTFDY